MEQGHVLAKYLSCCAASQSAETHICSRKVAKAGAAACPQCGGAGGGSDWAEAFATALCDIFECPQSVQRKVIDLVTSAVAFEPRAEDPDSDRSLGESPSHFSASEDAVPRPCHDERPTADGDSRPGAAGILELAAKAREGSGPVGATIGDTGDGDESDEGLGSSWGSVSSVQDEAPAEGFEGFSRRGGGTSAGRRGGGACGRIGVVDFEDDEEDDETVLRGVWFPRPDVTAPSFEANAASRTGGADLKGARETSSVPWEVGRAKGAAGHETPAVDVTPRVSPPPRPPPLQAAPRRERHEAAATVATSSAHPGGRARGWWDSGNGYHATASPSNGRGCRNVRGDQPGLGSEGGENGDARHGGLRATASTVYHGEVGVSRSSSLGAPHVARGGEGNGRRSTPPPALNRSRSENRRPRVEVRDDAGNVREVVESGLASRSTRNAVDFSGDARESQSGNEPDRLRFGGGRNLEDVSFPHERDLLIAQDSFSGEDDEGSESGYEEFVVLVSREATVKELAAKVADFPAEWLGEAFGTVIRRQVEGGTYDARARAAMKRAVRLLGGRVSWRQIVVTERELARLAQHREARIKDGDQNKEAPVTGRYWKVGLAAAGGGVLLFLSGGVAAPSVTASLSAVGFAAANSVSSVAPSLGAWLGYTSAAAAASAAVSGTAGAIGAGAAGAGVAGYKMTRRTAGVQEFHFLPLHSKWPLDSPESMFEGDSEPGLPVFICIPGWHEPGHDPRHTWGGIGYGSPTHAGGAETGDSSLPRAWPVEAEDEEDGELVGGRPRGAAHQVTATGIPTAEVEPPSRSVSTAQAVTSSASVTPTNARCARVSVRLPSPARSPDDGFSTPAIPIPMAHATAVQRRTLRGRTFPRTVSAVPTSVAGPGISCQPPRAELAVLHRPGADECRVSPTGVVQGRVPGREDPRVAQPGSEACAGRHQGTMSGVTSSSYIDLSGPSHLYLGGRSCGGLGFEAVEPVTAKGVRTDREIQYPGEGGSRAPREGEEAAGQGVGGGVGEGMDGSWEALPSHAWWRDFVPGGEEHVLVWERGPLTELYSAMRDLAWKSATRRAVNEVLKRSALAPVVAAAAWPLALLDAASGLDDPWGVVRSRALEAGRLLAAVLLSRPVGSRPVTLLGYSMGAKVVFNCLEALAAAPGDRGLGIVENAVMLGTPVGTKRARWKRARSAVAGRLVNGFSSRDWLLALIYRSKSWSVGVAGTARVEGCGVENIDLSGLIVWHLNYPRILPTVMAMLRLED